MIVAIAPIAGRLTDRIGARIPIAVGLSLVSVAMFWLTTIDTSTTYGDLFPSFILMGVGMALVMSPMSTAAMNAVADAKAGIASGILSMNRMIGGTLGVAVIGAVFQGAARSRLDELLARIGADAPPSAATSRTGSAAVRRPPRRGRPRAGRPGDLGGPRRLHRRLRLLDEGRRGGHGGRSRGRRDA